MNSKSLYLFLLLFSFNLHSEANDSVVEISSSGLIFSEEKNISMTKEILDISEKEISVQYEFENESKNEVDVTIGFPIPPFGIEWPSNTQSYPPDFGNFKVMVNGVEVKYLVEVKAVTENGEDITNFLKEKKINYQIFGGFDIQPLADGIIDSANKLPNYEINTLSKEEKQFLISKGALREDGTPLWLNKITYYWNQKFPSGKVTKISHTYTPYVGGAFTYEADSGAFEYPGSACIDPALHEKFSKHLAINKVSPRKFERSVDIQWVRYILVTANSWKMPIKNFELILRKQPMNPKSFISLCWDGSLKKISETEFRGAIKNFKPEKDLLIYWYNLK